jgi:hypothetical protein
VQKAVRLCWSRSKPIGHEIAGSGVGSLFPSNALLSRAFTEDIKNPTGKTPGRSHQPPRPLSGDSIPINIFSLIVTCVDRQVKQREMQLTAESMKLSHLRESAHFVFSNRAI